jgi:hypothetical protein
MRYELSDYEWTAIRPMLPNKPRGVRRVNDRRVLGAFFGRLELLGEPYEESAARAVLRRKDPRASSLPGEHTWIWISGLLKSADPIKCSIHSRRNIAERALPTGGVNRIWPSYHLSPEAGPHIPSPRLEQHCKSMWRV